MQSRFLRSVAVAAVLIISLVGCGGIGAANQGDPQGAVKGALEAASAGGLAKLADFACADKKDDISGMFGGGDVGSLTALGLSAEEVFDAMKMEFKDIQTTEKSRTGDNAVVHVTGTMNITMDPTKMRELMKKAMAASGQTVDDATLDGLIASMSGSLSQSQPLDEDIPVVQENGKWLLCG